MLGQDITAAETHGRGELLERWDTEKGKNNIHPKECVPSNLLLPGRPHLLKFPEPPQIASPGRDQTVKNMIHGDNSY